MRAKKRGGLNTKIRTASLLSGHQAHRKRQPAVTITSAFCTTGTASGRKKTGRMPSPSADTVIPQTRACERPASPFHTLCLIVCVQRLFYDKEKALFFLSFVL